MLDKKPRVYIYYKIIEDPWGGINSFFSALRKYLIKSNKVEVVSDYRKEKTVILLGSAMKGPGEYVSRKNIINLKAGRKENSAFGQISPGLRQKNIIIHRLDGLRKIYAGVETELDQLQIAINGLCDYTVFQSKYCENIFQREEVKPKNRIIIRNGADPEFFSLKPHLRVQHPVKVVTVNWSANTRKGFEIIKKFAWFKDVEVTSIGSWPDDISPKRVKILGKMHQKEIGRELRKHDIFLYPSRHDACPNAVYEALASGLPVLYHDSGGTPEICGYGEYGVPLNNGISECFEEMKEKYPEFISKIIRDYKKFTINYSGEKYIDLIYKLWNQND